MHGKLASLNSATCLCEKAEKMLLPVRLAFFDSRVDALFGASSAAGAAFWTKIMIIISAILVRQEYYGRE